MLEILFNRYTLSPPHLGLIPIHFIDLASPVFHDIPYLMNFSYSIQLRRTLLQLDLILSIGDRPIP
jgi:hypothetical protein